jgi:hypothetical protein
MAGEKVEVDKFKKLILDMYRGFPNFQYSGMVEQVVITQNVRDKLIEGDFLLKEKHAREGINYDVYMLGPNALALVSAWNTENLTRQIRILTIIVAAISALSLVIALFLR